LRAMYCRDTTLVFTTLAARLRDSAAVRPAAARADDDEDSGDVDGGATRQSRRRRRSAASVAADKLWADVSELERDVARQSAAMASPTAALAAFSSGGRRHEANAAAAFDRDVADRLKRCGDGVDALKALAATRHANAHAAEHAHLVVLHLYALLQRISGAWAALRQRRLQQQRQQQQLQLRRPAVVLADVDDAAGGADGGGNDAAAQALPEGERARLTSENAALLGRLRTDVDAARELERSVARVGVLQRAFASKVAEQAEQIDHVHAVMSDARSAVARGNDELLLAAAHGVDFRIFVLMFLVTMSVALLFLDWYQ